MAEDVVSARCRSLSSEIFINLVVRFLVILGINLKFLGKRLEASLEMILADLVLDSEISHLEFNLVDLSQGVSADLS